VVQHEVLSIKTHFNIRGDIVRGFEHHTAHAASAYWGGPYRNSKALVLTADGEGDLQSATVSVAYGKKISCIAKSPASASLGYLYMETTSFLGFMPMADEHRVMRIAEKNENQLIKLALFEKLSFGLQQNVFISKKNPLVIESAFDLRAFGFYLNANFRQCSIEMTAVVVQNYIENILLRWTVNAIQSTGIRTVCFGGGVAANTKAMGRIARMPILTGMFVHPSPGDVSLAEGAAYLAYVNG
jgi:predicted NodU family carbamoyl transferase